MAGNSDLLPGRQYTRGAMSAWNRLALWKSHLDRNFHHNRHQMLAILGKLSPFPRCFSTLLLPQARIPAFCPRNPKTWSLSFHFAHPSCPGTRTLALFLRLIPPKHPKTRTRAAAVSIVAIPYLKHATPQMFSLHRSDCNQGLVAHEPPRGHQMPGPFVLLQAQWVNRLTDPTATVRGHAVLATVKTVD